ncbi:MAG: response regulator [Cyclobacteriaceae bacterium]
MKRIAVIDDDEVFQLIIQKQIEMQNVECEILKFFNGEEAINYLIENIGHSEKLPQLIMLDVNMPIKDGWEFLEEYSQLTKVVRESIKLYMVTSSVIQSDIDKAKNDQNIIDFVSKPITNNQLKNMLQ